MPETRVFRSAAGRAALLRLLLLATVLASGAAAVLALVGAGYSERPGDLPFRTYDQLRGWSQGAEQVTAALFVFTAIVWFAWSMRAVSNATVLGAGETFVSPRGAIGWWFVPVANLVVPFAIILGLSRRLPEEESPRRDLLVIAWWLTFTASGLGLVASAVEVAQSQGAASLGAALTHLGWAQVGWSVAALLAAAVVRIIQSAETFRAARGRPLSSVLPNTLAALAGTAPVAPVVAARPGAVAGWPVPGSTTPAGAGITPPGAVPPSRPRGASRPANRLGWIIGLLIAAAVILPQLIDLVRDVASSFEPPTPRPAATVRPTARATTRPTARATINPASSPGPTQPTEAPIGSGPTTVPVGQGPTDAAGAGAFLMSHLANGDGTCRPVDLQAPASGELAAVDCDAAGASAVASLRYRAFGSAADATAAYDGLVDTAGVERESGQCSGLGPGELNFTTDDEEAGRVLCHMAQGAEGSTPTVDWVDERLAILGQAVGVSGDTLDDLMDWWRNDSGPE